MNQVYNAFISYSHSDCGNIAPLVQRSVENIGKPWYWIGRKRLKVFRDETDLSANPALWTSIETALTNSDHFILLASPRALESKWMEKEVEWWLSNKSISKVLIAVIKGNIGWIPEGVDDFDWQKTDCLPRCLKQRFSGEPLYVDLRPYNITGKENAGDEIGFKAQMVKIIAAIKGIPPREIDSDELRRQRGIKRFLAAVGGVLVCLVIGLLIMFLNLRNANTATENKLARSYWDISKRAVADNDYLKALNYTAEGMVISHEEDLVKYLLADIEPYLPSVSLKNIFFHENGMGVIKEAIFSPDGRLILTAGWDSAAILWSVETGKQMGSPLLHSGMITKVNFSPDGKLIATASLDNTVRIWDAASCNQVGSSLQFKVPVINVIFSPDGKHILTLNESGVIRQWDVKTQEKIGQAMSPSIIKDTNSFLRGLDYIDNLFTTDHSVVYSADGKRILAACQDSTARLWDAVTGKQIGSPMLHAGEVKSAVFSPDGKLVLTACDDGAARIWNIASRNQTGISLISDSAVNSAVFSPDGKLIVTASNDKTARLWDAFTGKQMGNAMRHEAGVISAVFSSDGKRILTASDDKTARLWETGTRRQIGLSMRHEYKVKSADFCPDGRHYLTTSVAARLWEAMDENQLVYSSTTADTATIAVFSPDGKFLLTGSDDHTARLWDISTGTQVCPPMQHNGPVKSAVFSTDGKRILTVNEAVNGQNQTGHVWDALSGRAIGPDIPQEGTGNKVYFSPGGEYMVTSNFSELICWDMEIGKQLFSLRESKSFAGFSPDGKRILLAESDGVMRLWDIQNQEPVGDSLGKICGIEKTLFSPDGKWLLSACNVFQLWNAKTGRSANHHLDTQNLAKNDINTIFFTPLIEGARFSPDGNKILTNSGDNTVRLWDRSTGRQIGPAMVHDKAVLTTSFSANGKLILTTSEDNTVRIWEAGTGIQIGPSLVHTGGLINAIFYPGSEQVLTIDRDHILRRWNIGGDLDISPDLFKLQANIITGAELKPAIQEIQLAGQWADLKEIYNNKAREHFKVCKYPVYNIWRRFNLKEAAKIR